LSAAFLVTVAFILVFQEYGSGAASANQSEGHESTRMARMASEKQSRKNTQVNLTLFSFLIFFFFISCFF